MTSEPTALPYPELNLHLLRQPTGAVPGPTASLSGRVVTTLRVEDPTATAFAIDFDTLQRLLGQLPRMFLELDGSFMWAGNSDTQAWRLDGMVFENSQTVRWIELKGQCPLPAWEQLLTVLEHDQEPVMALWLPEQYFLDAATVQEFWI